MSEIEEIVEGNNVILPDYSGHVFTDEAIARGSHRNFVGGVTWRWEHGGNAQLKFLKQQGLRPHHTFLDVGCGSLRAGRKLVDYLEPGHYYGVDANRSILQAGYDVELTDEQRARLPVENLRANDRFNADFGVGFDYAIAQSVFTHVSLNHMRLCLHRLSSVMKPGGVFFASFMQQPVGTPVDHTFKLIEAGRTYFNEKNVYWYDLDDMKWAGAGGPWSFRFVGQYGSSDQQLMVAYTRLDDAAAARKQAVRRAERWVRVDATDAVRKVGEDTAARARAAQRRPKRFLRRVKRTLARTLRQLRSG